MIHYYYYCARSSSLPEELGAETSHKDHDDHDHDEQQEEDEERNSLYISAASQPTSAGLILAD